MIVEPFLLKTDVAISIKAMSCLCRGVGTHTIPLVGLRITSYGLVSLHIWFTMEMEARCPYCEYGIEKN
jgi:hypothetical protein